MIVAALLCWLCHRRLAGGGLCTRCQARVDHGISQAQTYREE